MSYSYSTNGEQFHGKFDTPEQAAIEGFTKHPEQQAVEIGEAITHPWLNRAIETAQKSSEAYGETLAGASRSLTTAGNAADLQATVETLVAAGAARAQAPDGGALQTGPELCYREE